MRGWAPLDGGSSWSWLWPAVALPWDTITSVWHSDDSIRIGRAKDSSVDLSPTGWAWLERRLAREPHAERTAEEVQALLLRPELRPPEEAPAGQQGMPFGPPLVVLSVLWGVAVLLLL